MMEQAHAREGHDHVMRVAARDHVVVTDRTTRLRDVLNAALERAQDVVAEREERVRTERDFRNGLQVRFLFFLCERFRALCEIALPDAVGEDVLFAPAGLLITNTGPSS